MATLYVAAPAQTLSPELDPSGTVTIVAGGAASSPATGTKCGTAATPVSTDNYGSGCLATQVAISGARYVIQDAQGNFFISDYGNNIIRRVDATTGIVTRVAGGGSVCATATDIFGDGCNSLQISLGKPLGLAFAPNGDLYFVDGFDYAIRKITAVAGVIPVTGGIVSNVAGYAPPSGKASYGFVVSNSTTSINAATASYIDGPFGIRFNANGVLFSSEEFKNAIYAINVTATNQTVYGVTLKPGEIWKVVGTTTAAGAGSATASPVDCPNGTSGTFGCNYISSGYTEGGAAGANPLDAPYDVAFDPSGNLFIANEFTPDLPRVSTSGLISTYAGLQTSSGTDTTKRATAGTFGFGSSFGVTANKSGVVYFTDAYNGVVWRVDPDTKTMYVVAGLTGTAAGTPTAKICSSGDSLGNGCPALQASFGRSTSSKGSFADTTLGGIFGISVDAYDNLYVGDSITNEVRRIGTGQDFGAATTTKIFVHYFKGDSPKANGYTVSSTGNVISITGTPNCVPNADGSSDCEVDLLAQPKATGPYSGTLTAASTVGTALTVPLTGVYSPTPVTSIKVTATAASTCASTTYATTTQVTATATVTSVGGNVTGTVQFFDNGAPIGSAVTPVNNVATLTQTFPAGNHSITATYNGDGYYTTSTTTTPATFTTSAPAVGLTAATTQKASVPAGGTALYSFTANSNVYTGNIVFACTGLPAGASCVFSPTSITATGCSANSTVALSVYTTQAQPIKAGGFAAGRGRWNAIAMLAGVMLAVGVGMRRRKMQPWLRALGMLLAMAAAASGLVACSSNIAPNGATPSGTYSVTVTAVGTPTASATTPGAQSIVFPLTIQ